MTGGLAPAVAGAIWPALQTPEALRAFAPRAQRAGRPIRSVLVLEAARNASVDYYLRPRLEAGGRPWRLATLSSDPAAALAQPDGLFVVVCRYATPAWLAALERVRPLLAGLAFFVDDDLPAMMTEPAIPLETRLKVAVMYGRHVERLERLADRLWVSTPALDAQIGGGARVLPPLPFDAPRRPRIGTPPRIVYHGTLTHGEERAFVRDVARRVRGRGVAAPFELAGGFPTWLRWRGVSGVEVRPQLSWTRYLEAQARSSASLLLAPLTPGRVNAARAAVKRFDAARLGAVGLYADTPPYADAVRNGIDGLLLPMDPEAWAAAIETLATPGPRWAAMAEAAWARIEEERHAAPDLFDGEDPCA